ncbi:MAG: hypothetical protein HRU24_17590 [Gammaproteobacteria bacterium]|nr:hypothetical protein [Gammaproteobacteria bacterium]
MIYRIIFSFFLLVIFVIPSKAGQIEDLIYADLLTRGNSVHIKVSAQSIYNKQLNNQRLHDLAAQLLAQSLDGTTALNVDTQSWLAKALGTCETTRYQKLLNSIISSGADSKLKKYTRLALEQMGNKSAPSFVKGAVDMKEAANRVKKEQAKHSSKATAETFSKVYTADTIDDVINKLGMPDDVDVTFGTRRTWGITATYSMLNIKYQDLGNFIFNFSGKGTKNWLVKRIVSTSLHRGDLSHHPMLSESPQLMRGHIRSIIKQGTATELDRDIAAERLYAGQNDDDFIDTLSWACKLLGTSGNTRYRKVLEHTIEHAGSRKLKKYAKKSLRQLGSGTEPQYQQGDIYKQ